MRYLSITIGIISFLIFTQSFAALPTYNASTEVSIPNVSGWSLGATGLYLQPSVTNGAWDYGSVRGTNPNSSTILAVDPGYDFGAGLNADYIFPGTANDFNIDFLYINTDNTDSFSSASGSAVIVPIPYRDGIVTNGGTFDNANSKGDLNFGQIDIGFGQYIGVGCRTMLHPRAGLHLAQIDEQLTTNYNGLRGPNDFGNMTADAESDFRAYGLMAGLDSSFYLGRGFGLVGHATGAVSRLEEDELKLEVSYVPNSINGLAKNTSLHSWIDTRYVPSLDGRLGLDYTYLLDNNANSMVTLETGYRVLKYFHAIDTFRVQDQSSDTNPNITLIERKTSDFALSGPYINLTYHHA